MIKKIAIGFIAGIISGLFGAGGGMIVVPALVYLFDMEEKTARGTTILSILPMVITSGIFYIKSDFIDWNIGIKCVIGGIIRWIFRSKTFEKTI